MVEKGYWGLLTSLDLHHCNPETIRDAQKIKHYVRELCRLMKVKRFGECLVVHFGDANEDIAGFSMVQLIETSLISGHFVNKTNNAYLDFFSCREYAPQAVVLFSTAYFGANDYTVNVLPRK